jgi:5-formyltetrahydrofolate cyclo-ligase
MSHHARDVRVAKAELRAAVLAARWAMPEGVRRIADRAITAVLVEYLRQARPTTVTAYVPISVEPGGTGLPAALAGALDQIGGRLLLPVLRPDLDLDWARYEGPASLAAAARGLREPSGRRLGVDAIGTAELVIVPALAVDHAGRRLGRGGGSYDRALARVGAGTLVVAPLYADDAVSTVPAQAHDRSVSAVVVAAPDGTSATWRSLAM